MPLKSLIASTIHRLAFASGFSVARARRHRAMRIIMFHAVGRPDYPTSVFEAQIRFLDKWFKLVPLASIVQKIADGKGLPDNEVALTFDDGTRNNFTLAYPILKRRRVPATFFICPGLVEERKWLWNQDARERLRILPESARKKIGARWGAGSGSPDDIVEWMKLLPGDLRAAAEADIRSLTPEFTPEEEQRHLYDLMNWTELASMDPDLITIGSHTAYHSILPNVSSEELVFEVRESRRLLEENLRRPVEFFCYPNGMLNPGVVSCVQQHYRAAVTTAPAGYVLPGRSSAFRLPRISIAQNVAQLAWRMHYPAS